MHTSSSRSCSRFSLHHSIIFRFAGTHIHTHTHARAHTISFSLSLPLFAKEKGRASFFLAIGSSIDRIHNSTKIIRRYGTTRRESNHNTIDWNFHKNERGTRKKIVVSFFYRAVLCHFLVLSKEKKRKEKRRKKSVFRIACVRARD